MKRTIAVLLILAGLGAYVYFVEIKGTEKKERAEKASKRLIPFAESSVNRLRITNESGEIDLRKTGDRWMLAAPVSAPADESAVSALITALIASDTKDAIDGAADAAAYGLQPPKITIEVGADGATEVIKIGKRSPVGQDLYVQRGNDAAVYQATGGLDSSTAKKADEFRDKRLWEFRAEEVTAVTVKNAGKTVALRRNGAGWVMEANGSALAADDSIANGLAQDLANLRIARWRTEAATPADFESAGLKSPSASIEVELGDGKVHTIVFGKSTGNEQPVNLAGQPQIVEIASWSAQQLLKTPEQLRDRRLMPVAADQIDKLVLRVGSNPAITIRRDRGLWDVSGGATGKANNERMTALLAALTELRANEFQVSTPQTRAQHLLAPPLRTLEAFDAAGKQLGILHFGKNEEDWALWAQTGDKQVEAKIPNDFVKNKWPNDPQSLFQAPAAEAAPEQPGESPEGHP